MQKTSTQFWGELVGTFLLVFFGCSSVAISVIFDSYQGLFQIAALWGIGLTIAIKITGPMSGAHLNPAVSLAFALLTNNFSLKKLPLYFAAQLLGAFLAAATLHLLFAEPLRAFEQEAQILRGSAGSEASAKMFGEFHPQSISTATASLAEFLGTALLAFVIFRLADPRNKDPLPAWAIPPAIGGTLTLLISLFAPLSMAGFNPARDFAPRLYSSLVGWEGIPFTANGSSWLIAYIIAPCLGALAGGYLAQRLPKS